jgi:hypothetical protein
MQKILKSVGQGGVNDASDTALVQIMLMKANQLTSVGVAQNGYLDSYDGVCGQDTKTAIRGFQDSQKWKPIAPGKAGTAGPVPGVKPGLIEPDDPTWKALVEQTPAAFQNLRVLPGARIAYLEGSQNQRVASVTAAYAETFATAFVPKVISCINEMHARFGIVISVCRDGARRDFATQDRLLNDGCGVTNAGPGESNHNFGMAVDFGFKGLRWVHRNGTIEENEDSWLHKLDPHQTINEHAARFWDALRTVGTSPAVGLFRGPVDDHPHLQSWSDKGVDMGVRLADLLTRSGTMKWSVHYVKPHYRYRSDLGWGGALVDVGTASEIWQGSATITLAGMESARKAIPKQAGPAAAGAARPALTETDLLALKKSLQHQFELAAANWQNWTPH